MMVPRMRDGLSFKKHDSVPPVSDAWWQPLTAALLDYVKSADRTIDDIVIWGSSQKHTGTLIRHMLAWLSFTGAVDYDTKTNLWYYISNDRASNDSPAKNGDDRDPSD